MKRTTYIYIRQVFLLLIKRERERERERDWPLFPCYLWHCLDTVPESFHDTSYGQHSYKLQIHIKQQMQSILHDENYNNVQKQKKNKKKHVLTALKLYFIHWLYSIKKPNKTVI